MFASSLTIENFRCFSSLSLEGLNVPDGKPASGLNLLVGENGNGKTTLLEAINLVTQSSFAVANTLDISDFADMSQPLSVDYTSDPQFRCKMPAIYRNCYFEADGIAFTAKVRDRKSSGRLLSPPLQAKAMFKNTTAKYMKANGEAGENITDFHRGYSDDSIEGDSLNIFYFDKNRSRHLTQGTYKTTFERICDDLNWRFATTLNKEPAKKQALIESLDGDFFDLAIKAAQSSAGQRVADDLADFFDEPRYKNLRLDLVNYLRPFSNGVLAMREDESLAQIMARDLGSGIEIIIALLMLRSISGASKGKIIYLIDEPEAHLHPKAQKQLLRLLVEESKDKQIFVSTHSPYIFKDAFPTKPGMFIFRRDVKVVGGSVQAPAPVTLQTYIRNSIHHPENKQNAGYTDDELRQSSVAMMALIETAL